MNLSTKVICIIVLILALVVIKFFEKFEELYTSEISYSEVCPKKITPEVFSFWKVEEENSDTLFNSLRIHKLYKAPANCWLNYVSTDYKEGASKPYMYTFGTKKFDHVYILDDSDPYNETYVEVIFKKGGYLAAIHAGLFSDLHSQ